MKKYKLLIETVSADDKAAIKDMQKKLNQWITVGLLKKYELLAVGNMLVFNICMYKEAESPF